jgi:hypothetical protein
LVTYTLMGWFFNIKTWNNKFLRNINELKEMFWSINFEFTTILIKINVRYFIKKISVTSAHYLDY